MADMIKFFKGLETSLPASGVNGALYITTDEGAIYLGTGTGMKRLGDFVQVDNVASLPTKAHETCLYYCVAENILAKWNGTEWKQVNKQPTAEEMKTLLGLGTLAYKSEVAEDDLNADLKAKVNAAAEGNHSHANSDVLNGITADKVAAWDAAEQNAKDYADGLDEAMNARVEALESIDHEHANKAELDLIASGDKAKWDAAVEKAHSHTFVESELNKIVDGDVAKWNAVVADHLTADDKAALENSIKEAKKAGTDANTNIEAYKVTNDARVLAVEEDIAEITGDNGILAQAKSYSDGKLATARTEISAEIDADVKVVADDLAGYKTANDSALAGVKATAEAAATKEYTDAELAKKVDKVEGKSLVSDTEITKLAGVSEGANKVEASENNGKIKIDGVETVVYTHPEKHAIADVDGLEAALAGLQTKGDYAAEEHTHVASEITDLDATIKGYDYATKTEAKGYADAKDEAIAAAQKTADDITTYVGTFTASEGVDTVVKYIDAKTANIASDERVNDIDNRVKAIEADYVVAADIADFETKDNVKKVADDLAAYVESNDAAVALKADKSVVDAMYTNEQIDGFIAEAKKYADDNDADTKYGIVYDSDNKKIKLVEGGTDVEIDASAFIKDGMISNVTIGTDNDLVITFNTDAGKENIVLPLDQLVDIYTGVEGARVKVTVNADKSISADLVAGSIGKDYLDDDVKASLALADSAVQDISHLATTEALNGVDAKFANYTTTTDLNAALALKADKTQVATDIATAKEEAIAEASNQDAVILAEAQAYADTAKADAIADAEGKVNALADNVYTKDEVEALLTWGEF